MLLGTVTKLSLVEVEDVLIYNRLLELPLELLNLVTAFINPVGTSVSKNKKIASLLDKTRSSEKLRYEMFSWVGQSKISRLWYF